MKKRTPNHKPSIRTLSPAALRAASGGDETVLKPKTPEKQVEYLKIEMVDCMITG